MVPECVWAKALFIYESRVGADGFDFCDPVDVDAWGDFDTVGDNLALVHGLYKRASDFKSEFRGCDFVEIVGV